ncbi:MAG: Fur family transcriptional regulator [Candidatus Excrementavichristensenella sp.]|jgi:Fur family ferric uptake transcriptional regulator
MNPRSKYKTKQLEILLGYLETIPGVHVSASEVYAYFKSQGVAIGQSTVYRQLERLVDEGVINKYTVDANSPACFEYVGAENHAKAKTCFHCKCEGCGKLIHLHCEDLEGVQAHLYDEHRFKLNPMRTVYYGLCDQCI